MYMRFRKTAVTFNQFVDVTLWGYNNVLNLVNIDGTRTYLYSIRVVTV